MNAVLSSVREFLFPKLDGWYLLRLAAVALTAFVVFRFVLVPARIHGHSMDPTYRHGGFTFCWRPTYAFGKPRMPMQEHRFGQTAITRIMGGPLW